MTLEEEDEAEENGERTEKTEAGAFMEGERNEEREESLAREEEAEEKIRKRQKVQEKNGEAKTEALASLVGALAQLGLSRVADELALFPILSTVEHFRNVRQSCSHTDIYTYKSPSIST